MIGQTVAQYRILEKLGQGGMGVVYRAEDTSLERSVALKFLLPRALGGGEERARFIHEARAAASLNHPNICTIHEIGEYEGEPFIAMEFVEGRSLSSLIAEGPLRLDRAVDIVRQVAEGLNEAHTNGVVHRDVKPDNIMVTDAGRVKIMDFGLAAAVGQTRLTREGTTVGTAAYMSPEQTRGERSDRRSDLWSLGAVMYEMITGRRPFAGDHAQALMYAIVNEEPEPPTAVRTGVPMELERIVLKALQKQPDDRYQHADDLLSDLRRFERAGAGGTSDTVARAQPKEPARRRGVISTVLIVAVVVVGYMVLRPLMEEQQLVAAPKPIAVISFENLSGDPAYDYLSRAIPNLLITSLEQSRYLRVTTWERMRDLVEQLGRKRVEGIDEALGFELCRLDGIDVIVTGSFVRAGNTFATDVKVLDVKTKELIASASARGDGVESILDSQVDALSEEIARGVGLSRRRIEETQRPVAEVTTTSMDAYNYYLRGVEEYDKFYYDDARRFLDRAITIDSTFAMAYVYLGSTYGYLKDRVSRNEMYEKAMRHAQHATERERLSIESRYATVIEGDNEKKRRLLQELVRKYPKEKRAYLSLAMDAGDEGRHHEAIEYLRKSLVLDPNFAPALNMLGYEHLYAGNYNEALEYLERYAAASPGDANPFDSMGEVYLGMGDLEQSIARYREAVEVKPDFFGAIRNIAYVYGVMGEYDSAMVWIDRYLKTVPTAGLRQSGYCWRSLYRFLTGRIDGAFADIDRWEELLGSDTRYESTGKDYVKAYYLCRTGRYAEAERAFEEWHRMLDRLLPQQPQANEMWLLVHLALVYARSGRADDAMAAIRRARSLQPEVDPEQPRSSIRLIEGEVLLTAGRYDEAIELVRDSLRVQIPLMASEAEALVHNLPMDGDVLARAYLARGDPDSAVAEYRRLIEFRPDSNNRRLRNPIYRYRLGKLYEDMGRAADAAEQYRRFLKDWRHADPDRDEYVDARKRLRALGG